MQRIIHFLKTLYFPLLFTLTFCIAVFCYPLTVYALNNSGSVTATVSFRSTSPTSGSLSSVNIDDTRYYAQYGYTSGGELSFSFPFSSALSGTCSNNYSDNALYYTLYYEVNVDYLDVNGGTHRDQIVSGTSDKSYFYASTFYSTTTPIEISYSGGINGTPVGINVGLRISAYSGNYTDRTFTTNVTLNISDFAFSSFVPYDYNGGGGTVEIKPSPELVSTQGLMSTNGFSPLILAANGQITFLNNFSYDSNFGYPAFKYSDIVSPSTVNLSLYEGTNDSIYNIHPIAFMGDLRKGDYEVVFGFITTSDPNYIDFSSGWSGELVKSQTAIPLFTNKTEFYYRIQYSPHDGYYYCNVFVRFSTVQEFDSLCIRSGPTIPNVVYGAFCVNKFVGTIADQLNQSDAHWTDVPSSTQQFNQGNSSTSSALTDFSTSEGGYVDNFDTAVESTNIENFDITVLGEDLVFIQGLVNTFYNILPQKLQYVIFASLVIGVLGAIVGALHYVVKHESHVSKVSKSKKKG